MKKLLVTACLALVQAAPAMMAQGVDLSAQKSESDVILPVPGYKADRHGIIINPVPQEIVRDTSGFLCISDGVSVRDRKRAFHDDTGFLPGHGPARINIDFGKRISAEREVPLVSGAYRLSVDSDGVMITGYDERGAFYGLQTLRQLIDSPAASGGRLPYVDILDYPDIQRRGVVEGFYGNPWPHETRLSHIEFYGRFKLDTYIYGPKDDPYHSCPYWREPYPESEARKIRELLDACQRNRVDFVWAVHPGQDFAWNEEDYRKLADKFDFMYRLGVRHFAIFFDDITGDGTDPLRQAELLNRLTDDFVRRKRDVSPLMVCPTDYNRFWSDPSDEGALAVYGRVLYPGTSVFWTGDAICSDLTPSTLDFVSSRICRPPCFWWNYPVNDYALQYILQGPVYGLDTSLGPDRVSGFVSNPMEFGEASKLALYSVADYTWNVGGYNPIDSWERALVYMMPGAADAYRTFAIHSCDTETRYRRDESWETETFTLDGWTDRAADAPETEFRKIEQVPGMIERGCGNIRLLEELRPWLEEFGKLGTRCRKAIEIARMYRSGADMDVLREMYEDNLMTREDRTAYEAHKSGTLKLQPFYEKMMEDFGRLIGSGEEISPEYGNGM